MFCPGEPVAAYSERITSKGRHGFESLRYPVMHAGLKNLSMSFVANMGMLGMITCFKRGAQFRRKVFALKMLIYTSVE